MTENERRNEMKAEQSGQIDFPIVLGFIIAAAAVAALIYFGQKDSTIIPRIKDLAIILAVLVLFVIGIVLLILFVRASDAAKRGNESLSEFMSTANHKVEDAGPVINKALCDIAEPFIKGQSVIAGTKNGLKKVFEKPSKGE